VPTVAGRKYPYTRDGIAAAEAEKRRLARASVPYEDILAEIEGLPIGVGGDLGALLGPPQPFIRKPTLRARIPLAERLGLSLEGNPERFMGILSGRW